MSENKLFEIIARVFNTPINEINDQSNPETIENWDSFRAHPRRGASAPADSGERHHRRDGAPRRGAGA